MKLDNAIKTALEHEAGVHKAYLDAVKKCSDESGKRVFRALADEEMGHINYLQERLAEWQTDGKIHLKSLGTSVPAKAAINKSLDDVRKTVKPHKHTNLIPEIELLKQALVSERKVSEFYKEMVAKLDGEGQQLFQRFVEIEEGHEAIVEAEIDSVSGSGMWLGQIEFGLEVS